MPVSFNSPRFQAEDNNGRPLVGGQLSVYLNKTTTPTITYQDAAGTAANTNPIILDGRGEAVIFIDPVQLCTFVLKDRNGALIWSQDDVSGGGSGGTVDGGIQQQEFTESGVFTVKAGIYKIYVSGTGAGGSGGKGGAMLVSNPSGGGGGGGGGGGAGQSVLRREIAVNPGDQFPITIGVGGQHSTTSSPGTSGTATTVGSILTLSPGLAGIAGGDSPGGGPSSGGAGGGGYPSGSFGSDGSNTGNGGAGASNQFGGGGGAGRAGQGTGATNGSNGGGYGSGGGGGGGAYLVASSSAGLGGDGAPGFVLIEWSASGTGGVDLAELADSVQQAQQIADEFGDLNSAMGQIEDAANEASGSATLAQVAADLAVSTVNSTPYKFVTDLSSADQSKLAYVYGETETSGLNGWYAYASGSWSLTPNQPVTDKRLKIDANIIFQSLATYIFPQANLPVRRYSAAGTFNDYAAGYSQTPSAGGLQVAIPTAGSGTIKHYLRTGLVPLSEAAFAASFVITSTPGASSGVGLGFRTGAGVYIAYALTSTGNFSKFTDFAEEVLQSGLTTYASGNTVSYEISNGILSALVNGTRVATRTLAAGEFATEVLIGQKGFLNYTAKMTENADPVRDYVNDQVAPLVSNSTLRSLTDDLFRMTEYQRFPLANLVVRRYTAAGVSNDYAAGQFQSATSEGLRVTTTQSGSAAIGYFLRAGTRPAGDDLVANFAIETTGDNPANGHAVGFGYIATNGDYVAYLLSASGVVRKVVNYTPTNITGIIAPYSAGDLVQMVLSDTGLEFKVNDTSVFTQPLVPGEFPGEVLIAQKGFPIYVVWLAGVSDRIRKAIEESGSGGTFKDYYSFDPTGTSYGTGRFKAFIHISDGLYIGFEIGRWYDMAPLVYMDYWRLEKAKYYVYNGEGMSDTGIFALTDGESECVFKRTSAKDDFTGGYHGDEIFQDVSFFASGVRIDPALMSAAIPLTPCDGFSYLEKSTMYETAEGGVIIPGHPIECTHIKHTEFGNQGYRTDNRLSWVRPGLVSLWYHGISCVGKALATRGYTEADYAEYTFTGSSSAEALKSVGDREFWCWAEGISGYVTSAQTKPLSADATATLFINDRAQDSKYYRRSAAATVAAGDVWESVMTVKFGSNG